MSRAKTKKPQSPYVRDGRAPIPAKESTSRLMSSNKHKNTKPELTLRSALWSRGIRGYRLHYAKIEGKPDLVFVGRRIAIFIHGCFWHRCPTCNPHVPKSNRQFWQSKFKRNISRDKRHIRTLERSGWVVRTFWECRMKSDLVGIVAE